MNISFIFGFLGGCFATVIVQRSLRKFINPQIYLKPNDTKQLDFEKLFHDYSDFMNVLKHDFTAPNCKNIREFFVVDKDAILNSVLPRLRYELLPEILPALNRLEALGYIKKLKNNCLHYKIEEEFLTQLKSVQNIDSHLSGPVYNQSPNLCVNSPK